LYFFNEAYFAKTAPNYPMEFAFGTINNDNGAKKVQNGDTEAPTAGRLD
jgi:hypothetical protein